MRCLATVTLLLLTAGGGAQNYPIPLVPGPACGTTVDLVAPHVIPLEGVHPSHPTVNQPGVTLTALDDPVVGTVQRFLLDKGALQASLYAPPPVGILDPWEGSYVIGIGKVNYTWHPMKDPPGPAQGSHTIYRDMVTGPFLLSRPGVWAEFAWMDFPDAYWEGPPDCWWQLGNDTLNELWVPGNGSTNDQISVLIPNDPALIGTGFSIQVRVAKRYVWGSIQIDYTTRFSSNAINCMILGPVQE